MPRLLFEKKGNAIWVSHLDLMRIFQRAFQRAKLPLKHSQGFNPRPMVSIALPLSVGVDSACELLDFELDGCAVSCNEILQALNQNLISGIVIREVYEQGRKIRDLSVLRCCVTLEYDQGIPNGAKQAIEKLFSQESLIVPKKTKTGLQEQNIIPMIRSLELQQIDDNILQLDAFVCCQNPTLNPAQLILAISRYLPDLEPNFSRCSRVEVFDADGKIFR
ncbi:MAG: DUF2344 domain-containing protein [Oscillospiraceae bacterium]|nr:DUF2344 domain-containing protein [Oscillospiraceae bacterium]